MNKAQKEIQQVYLNNEKKVLSDLKKVYQKSLDDIDARIAELLGRTDTENLQSIIYQVQYQKALKKQINGILDTMGTEQFTTVSDYLTKCYEDGFVGTMYDLKSQGIPLIMPIDQEQVQQALVKDTKLSKSLYAKLGEDTDLLKRRISSNLSRGIAQGHTYAQIAKNIKGEGSIALNKTMRIARTEGHRITQESTYNAQVKAKEAGADVVKQWDSTIDKRTRKTHTQLDGQIRELDEPFEVNGKKAMYPGSFGIPSEDIQCRCVCLQRARWALDEEELETLQERAKAFGLDKTDSFEEFKTKYLKAAEEIKYPFNGKTFQMNPDGSLVEAPDDGVHDVFNLDDVSGITQAEIDAKQGVIPDGYDAIIHDDGTIELLSKDKAIVSKEGKKFSESVWTLNEDGTFTEGKMKYQAQYKLDIDNNKVISIDKVKHFDGDDKILEIIGELPDDLQDEIMNTYTAFGGGATYDDVLKSVLQKKGYQGLNIAEFIDIDSGEVTHDFIQVFDDSLVTKTKKSKLETLTSSLAKEQKKLAKINNKTYSGIWKDDVKVSDYSLKKGSIQAKKNWYLQQIAAGSPNSAQYQKYLDDLDEFEKLGSQYEAVQTKIKKINADIKKVSPVKAVSGDAFTQERKDAAYWFTDKNGSTQAADGVLRDKAGEVWRNGTSDEQYSTWKYTSGSGSFNRPLSGFEGGWGSYNYKGVGKVDLNFEGSKYNIEKMTDLLNRSEYDFDIWLQRGCQNDAIESFLNLPFGTLSSYSEADLQQFVGTNNRIYGFLSTSVSKGNGFSGSVIMNVYAPKGSKMIYAEPFSAYGQGDGKSWNGLSKQSYFGSEAEMILQRGGSYTVTKIEKKGSTIYMDVEVHPEDGYDLIQ